MLQGSWLRGHDGKQTPARPLPLPLPLPSDVYIRDAHGRLDSDVCPIL